MNQLVVKRACIFSLIFGAFVGLFALIPPLIGLCLFVLLFLSSVVVILFMKKNEKHLAFITNEQGAILGGIIGFFATIGFFITFTPLVCIISLIFKSYYSYTIPYMLNQALWLFFIVVFIVAAIFALTNSASGMGIAWLSGYLEKKPENHDAPLDINVD